jgi:phosphopantothenoylcysteine decarboxylase/phosphopantothenate--cysteine ligase
MPKNDDSIHPSSGPRLLVTAGPTHEPIDAVRFLGNRSSGRMGWSLADAAARRGWTTTLLLGPTESPLPVCSQVRVRRFRTAAQLADLLDEEWPGHDVLIMAAAVADYRPARPADDGKLRRDGPVVLELEPTPDLLAGLAARTRADQVTIGFALEPAERLDVSAREKLARKSLDAIVANPLETMGSVRWRRPHRISTRSRSPIGCWTGWQCWSREPGGPVPGLLSWFLVRCPGSLSLSRFLALVLIDRAASAMAKRQGQGQGQG